MFSYYKKVKVEWMQTILEIDLKSVVFSYGKLLFSEKDYIG